MNRSDSIGKIASALAKFQAEVSNPKNTAKNPLFNSKYAPLDVVINTIKPFLTKHSLSFLQSTGSKEENIVITTLLMHESGEWIESDPLILPAYQNKKGGVKEFNAQGAGSAISYGRRYSLSAMLGIASEEDEDANHSSGYTNQQNENQNKNQQKNQSNKNQQSQKKNNQKPSNEKPLTKEEIEKKRAEMYDKCLENYKKLKGDDKGFEEWIEDMMPKSTLSQINDFLVLKIKERTDKAKKQENKVEEGAAK